MADDLAGGVLCLEVTWRSLLFEERELVVLVCFDCGFVLGVLLVSVREAVVVAVGAAVAVAQADQRFLRFCHASASSPLDYAAGIQ